MKQTVSSTHEVFSRDNVIEVAADVYQGDVGSMEIRTAFTQGGEPLQLDGWSVSVANRAPNGDTAMYIGGTKAPLVVDGSTVVWALQAFDTAQAGTYIAQMRVYTDTQTVTVVFLRYNVERSLSGDAASLPMQFTSLNVLVQEVKTLQQKMDELLGRVGEMSETYDAFRQIMEDNQATWGTLPGKPESFPPSIHVHEQYALKTELEETAQELISTNAALSAVQEAKADRASVIKGALWASDWVGESAPYTQTINLSGIKKHGLYLIDYERSEALETQRVRETQWGYIGTFTQDDDKLTAICTRVKPGVDFRITLVYLGSEVQSEVHA